MQKRKKKRAKKSSALRRYLLIQEYSYNDGKEWTLNSIQIFVQGSKAEIPNLESIVNKQNLVTRFGEFKLPANGIKIGGFLLNTDLDLESVKADTDLFGLLLKKMKWLSYFAFNENSEKYLSYSVSQNMMELSDEAIALENREETVKKVKTIFNKTDDKALSEMIEFHFAEMMQDKKK